MESGQGLPLVAIKIWRKHCHVTFKARQQEALESLALVSSNASNETIVSKMVQPSGDEKSVGEN